MFIVIVGAALSGILLVMNTVTKNSADPLIHKQALSIAESLLEEIELMPYTYCDPNDATATTATSAVLGAGGCTAQVELIGPEAGETRYSATTPFDNVNDYNGFNSVADGGIRDISGGMIAALSSYALSVAVTEQGIPAAGASPAIASTEALRITVTVTGPDNIPVTLESYRTRYAPRAVP